MPQRHSAPGPGDKPSTGRSYALFGLSVAVSMGAAAWCWQNRGGEAAQQFLSGYLVELGLSADNLFVFVLVFSQLQLPPESRRRVLSLGIWGAVAMRALVLFAGLGLIRRFHPLLYVLGAFLVFAGLKLGRSKQPPFAFDPERSRIASLLRRWKVSPFLVALVTVETADLIFAFDSLPAVLGVTRSFSIAIASNACAILSLRSLYFILEGALPAFPRLKNGLAAILAFIGARMLIEPWFALPTPLTLAFIAAILALSFRRN